MDCRRITFLVLCFGFCAANDIGNVIYELKCLKERVNTLETLTENLLNGHVKSKTFIYHLMIIGCILNI